MKARTLVIVSVAVLGAGLAAWQAWVRLNALQAGGPPPVKAFGSQTRSDRALAGTKATAQVAAVMLDDAARQGWCTVDQSKRLGDALSERLSFLLDPKFEAWRAAGGAYGLALPKHPVHDDLEVTPEQFAEATAMLADATYEFDKARLRALVLGGKAQANEDERGSFGRAMFRLGYPRPQNPSDPGVTILEWVMPATLRQADGTVSSARVGLSFWWQAVPGRWVPYDVTVYFAPGPLRLKGHVL